MSQLLTRAEHIARAMLMGRVYDMRDGTYCTAAPDGHPTAGDMIDCVTLEVIPETFMDGGPAVRAKYLHRRDKVNFTWNDYDSAPPREWERDLTSTP